MSYTWHDVLGNIGVVVILLTYALLQLERMDPSGWRYSLANAGGAAMILISLRYDFNFSAAVLEGAWLLISLFGLWQARRRSSKSRVTE